MSTIQVRVCLWCGQRAYSANSLEKHFIEKHTGANRPVAPEPVKTKKKKHGVPRIQKNKNSR